MKYIKTFSLTLFLSISFFTSSLIAQEVGKDSTQVMESGNMIIQILDFSSDEGKVMVALHNSKVGYEGNNAFKVFASVITNGKVEYTFENIPFGTYAIKCYHDENLNGKMDTNMLGIPSEDYGFSNNATGSFGPANYEDAKFEFTKDKQTVIINID